jgi:phosphodiesterase/alkaline phosphatase D-like protein
MANHGATLNGTVNPQGGDTTYYFDLGTDTNYGVQSTGGTITASEAGDNPVAIPIDGLLAATVYHYRLNMTNSVGNTLCNDMTFTTPADVPVEGAPTGGTLDATYIF